MYKSIIRPIFFLINPERVHHIVVTLVSSVRLIPGGKWMLRKFFAVKTLPVKVVGIEFPNRVGLAAGFDKNASSFPYMALFGFGHIEVGTVTPKAQPGNEKPRSFRLCKDNALINRMGFNNHGVDAAVEKLKKLKRDGVIIGGNIGKNTATPNEDAVSDYLNCFIKLYDHVDYFVVNISCPNVTNLHHLQDKDSLSAILGAIVEHRAMQITFKPILLKISPDLNFNQIDDTLEVLKLYNIDGVVISNTTVTRDNLTTDKAVVESIGRGGLSGKPIRERSTELIRYVAQKTNHTLPIIGVGGIMSAADAQEKIDAGASLVQIYTGFIYEGPFLVKRINKQLR